MRKGFLLLVLLFIVCVCSFATDIYWWQPKDDFGDPSGDKILQLYEMGTYRRDSGTDKAKFYLEIRPKDSCYLVVKSEYDYQYSFYSGYVSIKDENGTVWKGPMNNTGYRSANYIHMGLYDENCWTSGSNVTTLKALMEGNKTIKLAFSSDYSSGNVTFDASNYNEKFANK